MNKYINMYIHAEVNNIQHKMTKTILYKLWFKIQLSTRAGARNPKPESCHDTDPAVTGGTGGCRLSPAVWGGVGGVGWFRAVCMALVSNSSPDSKVPGPTWGPPGSCGPQMGPMMAPWTLLSGSMYSLAMLGDTGEPMAAPCFCL